jgi:hypothetical protein
MSAHHYRFDAGIGSDVPPSLSVGPSTGSDVPFLYIPSARGQNFLTVSNAHAAPFLHADEAPAPPSAALAPSSSSMPASVHCYAPHASEESTRLRPPAHLPPRRATVAALGPPLPPRRHPLPSALLFLYAGIHCPRTPRPRGMSLPPSCHARCRQPHLCPPPSVLHDANCHTEASKCAADISTPAITLRNSGARGERLLHATW